MAVLEWTGALYEGRKRRSNYAGLDQSKLGWKEKKVVLEGQLRPDSRMSLEPGCEGLVAVCLLSCFYCIL